MSRSTSKKRATVRRTHSGFGKAVIASLKEFLSAAERGEPMTTRTVKVNLEPNEYRAQDVKRIRQRMKVSQAMFARLMAVSVKLVQGWEAGTHKPTGPASRLLDEIRIDPQQWLKRQFDRTTRKRAG